MIVRSVRVGIPVTEGIRTVAREAPRPTAQEFSLLADQIRIGMPIEEALRELATRNQLPEYRFFATALALQNQTGGGLAETLENLGDVIRKRVALKGRAHALASEARTSIIHPRLAPVGRRRRTAGHQPRLHHAAVPRRRRPEGAGRGGVLALHGRRGDAHHDQAEPVVNAGLLWFIGGANAVFIAVGVVLSRRLSRDGRRLTRVRAVQRAAGIDAAAAPPPAVRAAPPPASPAC